MTGRGRQQNHCDGCASCDRRSRRTAHRLCLTIAKSRVYDGVVLKVISAPELARNLDAILKALEESGTTLIIKHHDQPAALLVRFDAYVAMLATMDYSGWERWIDDVRAAFPTTVFSPPRRPKSLVPAFIDPADIGYAPKLGQVGTSAGRRRLAEELASMGIQLDELQLGPVYSLVLSLAERKRVLYAEDLKLAVEAAANAYVNALNWLVRPQAAPIVPSPSGGVIQGSAH